MNITFAYISKKKMCLINILSVLIVCVYILACCSDPLYINTLNNRQQYIICACKPYNCTAIYFIQCVVVGGMERFAKKIQVSAGFEHFTSTTRAFKSVGWY